jgi:anti-sigma B factor antagonist
MNTYESSLQITSTARGTATVVSITGTIDTLTADDLLAALKAEVDGGRCQLVGDMSRVDYTSSAGLRSLLAVMKECRRQGGDLRLAGVTDRVHKVLQLSGFTSILQLYTDVDLAIDSFAT